VRHLLATNDLVQISPSSLTTLTHLPHPHHHDGTSTAASPLFINTLTTDLHIHPCFCLYITDP
jgi:hypothetical protein